jgi:hypothetical protein
MICKNGTEGYYKYDFGFEQKQASIHISEHFSLNLLVCVGGGTSQEEVIKTGSSTRAQQQPATISS